MIREAEPRDAQAIERLYQELLPNNLNTKVLGERIEEIRNNPNSFLLVCEIDQKVIGTAHLHICLDALVENRPSELMKYIENICIQRNCMKMFLTSGASRSEAHHFYEKLGFDGESSKAFKKYL